MKKSTPQKVFTQFKKTLRELKRKKTAAGFLNYGVVAFGDKKKDRFLRVTKKPLIETTLFTARYLAVVDLFLLIGIALWIIGNPYGPGLTIFAAIVAIVVFADVQDVIRRAKTVERAVKKIKT